MKYFTLIPAALLSLTSFNVLASGYSCKTITGTINQLAPDLNTDGTPACHIKQAQLPPRYQFPDVTFLYPAIPDFLPASCFYTTLTARLGNREVTGTVYSGLTQNTPLLGTNYQFSAASVITLRQQGTGSLLGRIFTKDVIITPFDFGLSSLTREFVTAVNGTNTFSGVQGHIEVLGNLIDGDRAFTGMLCLPPN
jgi:hypothetical protein